MNLNRLAAAVLCTSALAATVPSHAAAVYTFSVDGLERFEEGVDPDGDGQEPAPFFLVETFGVSFQLTTASPITAAGDFLVDSCTITTDNAPSFFLCSDSQTFDPNGFMTGKNYIGLNLENADMSGSGTGFYFFDANAFTTSGDYTVFTGSITGSFDGGMTSTAFGNAGAGRLSVRITPDSNVPAPAPLALRGAGLLGASALRRVLARR